MINIGIIGVGRIGRVHAETITKRVPSARLVAIADRSPNEYKRSWAAEMGIDHISDNYRDILDRDDIDAVFICTSTDMHTKYSLEAIAAGKHVFCEKPVALTLGEIYEVEAALKGTNLKYQVKDLRMFSENDIRFLKEFESAN